MEAKTVGYKELLAQRAALEKQIEELRTVEREGVIDEILEKMALFELTPDDLGEGKKKSKEDGRKNREKRGPVAAKYRDPNTGATWSGRGIAPRWMAGQERTQFLIENS